MIPSRLGWRPVPAWSRPARFWLAWPAVSGERERDDIARQDCLGLAELLSEHAAVSMLAHPEDVAECSLRSPAGVSAVAARHEGRPVGRWAPLWLVDGDGVLAGAVARDPLARVMAEAAGVPVLEPPPGLDVGLLDCDGGGTALACTTLAQELGGRAQAESLLADWLGIRRVVWVEPVGEGGRIPARFVGPALAAAPLARDERAAGHAALAANHAHLAAAFDAAGRPFTVIDLPCPKRHGGCYADTLVAGRLVVVPAFEDRADDDAFGRLAAALPDCHLLSYPATFLTPPTGGGLGAVVAVVPS